MKKPEKSQPTPTPSSLCGPWHARPSVGASREVRPSASGRIVGALAPTGVIVRRDTEGADEADRPRSHLWSAPFLAASRSVASWGSGVMA